jgi:hypothetical protein
MGVVTDQQAASTNRRTKARTPTLGCTRCTLRCAAPSYLWFMTNFWTYLAGVGNEDRPSG